MKKVFLAILSVVLTVANLSAQTNLVPNPGFEEVYHSDTCIFDALVFINYGGTGFLRQLRNWFPPNPGDPPRLFTSCDTISGATVPDGVCGHLADAGSGSAYLFMETWQLPAPDAHPSIMVKLTHPLRHSGTYLLRMHVAACGLIQTRSNIMACFEKDSAYDRLALVYTPTPTGIANSFVYDSIITNCANWRIVEFIVHPTVDSLQYLAIGTFPAIDTTMRRNTRPGDPCYVFNGDTTVSHILLDEVALYRLDTIGNGIDDLNTELSNIHLFPNPAQNKIQVQTDKFESSYTWSLYDISGRLIQQYLISRKEQEIELPVDLNSGMYLWKGEREGVLLNCGKLLVE
jgi:Secretion system C-terminal sorting domain